MPWEPYIDAKFGKPFVDNLERILRRDEEEALAWAGVAGAFADYRRVDWYETDQPVVRLLLRKSEVVWSEDRLEETHYVAIQTERWGKGDQLEALFADVQGRVRALDMILRTAWAANPADFAVGYTEEGEELESETFATMEFDIGEHSYADFEPFQGRNAYTVGGGFVATLKIWEART